MSMTLGLEPQVRREGALPPNYWRYTLQAALVAILLIAVLSGLLLWDVQSLPAFAVGGSAPRDVFAPFQITYVSELETAKARERAASAVQDVYTAPDTKIIEEQLARARDIFDYITTLRNDPYLSTAQAVAKVQEIPDLNVPSSVILAALAFDEESWQNVISITLRIMQEVMSQGIRESQLLTVRSRLVTLLSSEVLPAEQEKVVLSIAHGLIKPTSFFDAQATEEAKRKARAETPPVRKTIERGQAVIRAGEIVTPEDMEELEALGLLRQAKSRREILGALLLSTLLVATPMAFIHRLRPGFWVRWRRLLLICLAMISTVTLARFLIPGRVLLAYLFPMAAVGMFLTVLLEDAPLAVVLTSLLSLAVGYAAKEPLALAAYTLVSGIAGALSIVRRDRLSAFIGAGVIVSLFNVIAALAFAIPDAGKDLPFLLQLITVAVANGILSASVAFAGVSWIGRAFGFTTSLQLLELAKPTEPLLKQLALKAPGTYAHSIIVANMAEQAAEMIGADGLLARIGAYYHDIGKSLRPYFFIENTTEQENVHAHLDPKTSAQIITSHVKDGVELAKKYRLPQKVRDIIAQHHGTTLVSFFYQQAAEEGQADEADYRYPGPKPQSREAAIVMLADVEASIRAARPTSLEETERLVRQFINARLVSGELDECDLTLRDLDQIRSAFVSVLKGVFHPRIQYPTESGERARTLEPAVTSAHEEESC